MFQVFKFCFKWCFRIFILALFLFGFVACNAIDSWEEPCSSQATPWNVDPCAEGK